MGKRGAYFFVIDAMIAGAIIFASLLFIFSTHSVNPEGNPTLRGTEDFLKYIGTTRLREYQSSLVDNMTRDGNITNLDNTLLDQMVSFYYAGNNASLEAFTGEVASRVISPERGILVYLNDDLVYNSTYHKAASTIEQSSLVISGKRMSYHMINYTTVSDPIWIEVRVWV